MRFAWADPFGTDEVHRKDFYKPIITPHELIHALAPPGSVEWAGKYDLEFKSILDHGIPPSLPLPHRTIISS